MIEAVRYMFFPVKQRRACSFPGLIYAILIGAVLSAILLAASSSHGQETDPQRAALVHVGTGGSGVCVSPEGLIFTAAHCVAELKYPQANWRSKGPPQVVPKSTVNVRFPGRETQPAAVIGIWWVDKGCDLALLSVKARGGLPYLPFARTSPAVGEQVTSIGYPAGHFARFESAVTFVGKTQSSDGPIDIIQTSHRANPGHSGGPLLNSRGEVAGICSMGSVDMSVNGAVKQTDQISLWSRCEYFAPMMREAGITVQFARNEVPPRPIIDVWYTTTCGPCHQALADARNLVINYKGEQIDKFLDVVPHDFDVEIQARNRAGVTSVPTFIIRSTGEKIVGYTGPEKINAKIVQLLAGQPIDVEPDEDVGGRDPPVDPAPPPKPKSATTKPEPTPEPPDATGVQLVILVKKQNLGLVAGTALTVVEIFAEKNLAKKLNTALKNKADVQLVFQRTNPAKFSALLEATGANSINRNAMIVCLIPKRFTGIAGNIASVLESKLKSLADGDWKHSTITTIAEREDPDGYEAMTEALDTAEASAPLEENWFTHIWIAITSGLAGIGETVFRHKQKAAQT